MPKVSRKQNAADSSIGYIVVVAAIVISVIGTQYLFADTLSTQMVDFPHVSIPTPTQGVKSTTKAPVVSTATTVPTTVPVKVSLTGSTVSVYADELDAPWEDWSWNTSRLSTSTRDVRAGTHSMLATYLGATYPGLYFHIDSFDTTGFSKLKLSFYVSSAAVPNLTLEIRGYNDTRLARVPLLNFVSTSLLHNKTWYDVTIPLASIGVTNKIVTGIAIIADKKSQVTFDEIYFSKKAVTTAEKVVKPSVALTATSSTPVAALPQKLVLPIELPYVESFASSSPWQNAYGSMTLKKQTLHVGNDDSGTASLALLSGSETWNNYAVDTTVDWGEAASFSIVMRNSDLQNRVECSFGRYGSQASIYQTKDGHFITYGSTPGLPVKDNSTCQDIHLGASNSGNTIECLVNGSVVLKSEVDMMPKSGAFGFATWNARPGQTDNTIKSLSISSI